MTRTCGRGSLFAALAGATMLAVAGFAMADPPPIHHPIGTLDDLRIPAAVSNQTFEVAIDNGSYWFAYVPTGNLTYNITVVGSSNWLNETVDGPGGFILDHVTGQRTSGTYRFSFMGSATVLIADMAPGLEMQAKGSASASVNGPVASFFVSTSDPTTSLRVRVSLSRGDVSAYLFDRPLGLVAQREDVAITKDLQAQPTGDILYYLVLLAPTGPIGSVGLEYGPATAPTNLPPAVVSPWTTAFLLLLLAITLFMILTGERRGWWSRVRARFAELRLPRGLRELPFALAATFLLLSLVSPWWIVHADVVQRDPRTGAQLPGSEVSWTVSYGLWGNTSEQSGGAPTYESYDPGPKDKISVVFQYAALLLFFGQGGGIAISLLARGGRCQKLLLVLSGAIAASAILWVAAELPGAFSAMVAGAGPAQGLVLAIDSFLGSRTMFIMSTSGWSEARLAWGPGLGWILAVLSWLAVLAEVAIQGRRFKSSGFPRKRR